jgi:copper(I)-binding protein
MLSVIAVAAFLLCPARAMDACVDAQWQAAMVHQIQMKAPAKRTFKVGDLVVEAPWLRATPGGAKVAGGYMKITNNGQTADRLIGGTLERAKQFEVHEMTMDNDVMKMRKLVQGLEIKPGQTVELKPGGYHIMGLDLASGYKQGDSIKGTLVFEKAGTILVEYTVAPVGAKSGGGKHTHH